MTSSFDMSAKALQARAKRAVDELSDQAMQRVEARLLRNDRRDQEAAGASGAPISKPTALLPAAVNQESNIMAQLQT